MAKSLALMILLVCCLAVRMVVRKACTHRKAGNVLLLVRWLSVSQLVSQLVRQMALLMAPMMAWLLVRRMSVHRSVSQLVR